MAFIPGIAEQQVEQSAFLWLLRDRALHGRRRKLEDAARIDNRLEAHLQGLQAAGLSIWQLCREPLAKPAAGEIFTAANVALRLKDDQLFAECLRAGKQNIAAGREVASALAWSGLDGCGSWLHVLGDSKDPWERWIAISAGASLRHVPHLQSALGDSNFRVRARAARAAGELGRTDLRADLASHLQSEQANEAVWAAWCLLLFSRNESALRILDQAIQSGLISSPWVLAAWLQRMEPEAAADWLRAVGNRESLRPIFLLAQAALGDIKFVPSLLEQVEDPCWGRLAADVFSMLTGWEPGNTGAEHVRDGRSVPDPDQGSVAPEEVRDLRLWWSVNRQQLPYGVRLLAGKPYSYSWVLEVLRERQQGLRTFAAIWLALQNPSSGLFPLFARASWQTQELRGRSERTGSTERESS
jgi:uncharacterized protein (TIGR02270 family)